jgi:hypothetical protein
MFSPRLKLIASPSSVYKVTGIWARAALNMLGIKNKNAPINKALKIRINIAASSFLYPDNEYWLYSPTLVFILI